jgi:hypothetical protein
MSWHIRRVIDNSRQHYNTAWMHVHYCALHDSKRYSLAVYPRDHTRMQVQIPLQYVA